jgi:hypothetical protein
MEGVLHSSLLVLELVTSYDINRFEKGKRDCIFGNRHGYIYFTKINLIISRFSMEVNLLCGQLKCPRYSSASGSGS